MRRRRFLESPAAEYARAGREGRRLGFQTALPSPLGTGTDWGDLLKAAEKIGLRWKLGDLHAGRRRFRKGRGLPACGMDAGRPVVIDFKFHGPRVSGRRGWPYARRRRLHCRREALCPLQSRHRIAGLQLMTAEDLNRYGAPTTTASSRTESCRGRPSPSIPRMPQQWRTAVMITTPTTPEKPIRGCASCSSRAWRRPCSVLSRRQAMCVHTGRLCTGGSPRRIVPVVRSAGGQMDDGSPADRQWSMGAMLFGGTGVERSSSMR